MPVPVPPPRIARATLLHHRYTAMKPRITLAHVDRMQSTVDSTARLHRCGLVLSVAAILCVALSLGEAPVAWAHLAGFAATVLAFITKAAATVGEIRLAGRLGQVMAMPYRRAPAEPDSDTGAWAAIQSYLVVSVVLTLAAALTPSLVATIGDTAYTHLTIAITTAALFVQAFDNPRRLRQRVMQICRGRLDLHAHDDGQLMA
jgi:hypothetical protein